ncbi:Receptor kinase [Rhynchospora pubera]|uniref:Receptor kinase n=1 Tax=Rhynchospora pubera TaxID=906938 RepID=A0AAV8FE95_9POAL|nr:Receptor kinase [Rhynchospora pubera]
MVFSLFLSATRYILLVILLLNGVVLVKGGNNHKKTSPCPPSSCGHLHDIHYPFRLETDPPQCGSIQFELSCKVNEPYISWQSEKFYVMSISYSQHKINMIDPALVNGTCNPATSPIDISYEFEFDGSLVKCEAANFNDWQAMASFVSCSSRVDKYWYYGCQTENNSLLYVIDGNAELSTLEPSCRCLSSTYISKPIGDMNNSKEVFDTLGMGFRLCWHKKSFWKSLEFCFQEAARDFGYEIPNDGRLPNWVYFLLNVLLADSDFSYCMGENLSGLTYGGKNFTEDAILTIVTVIIVLILQLCFVLILLCRFIFMPCALFSFLAHKYWSSKSLTDDVERFLRNQKTLAVTRFSYTDIIAITNHFRDKLGEGGFGTVFKGTILRNRYVAVKMLRSSRLKGEEFINEVSTLGSIHHRNIVRLIGYCSEESKKALVYEYMPKGSLDKHIFRGNSTPSHFSWYKIKEIALGVAQGINYLHRECEMRILHFDIKPHNILLDYNFVPKISDFGLAKLYPRDFSMVSLSIVRGTAGYIAPELLSRNFGGISDKADVYSYGMLLLEMAGGRRNWSPELENRSQEYYPSWMYDQLLKCQDQEINLHIDEIEAKLCKVGLWCIQMKPSDRPSMSEIVEMLEGDSFGDGLQMPPSPFFSTSATNYLRSSEFGSIPMSMIFEQHEDGPLHGNVNDLI